METSQASPESQSPEVADFGNIAISFSGGGYRAAAFHLGSLDFLQKVSLLDRVTMLSTVSGGTITGAKYVFSLSQALQDGQKHLYENFYNELYTYLLETRLPDLWLKKLHTEDKTDKPSLIVAAAEVYNEGLFSKGKNKEGARFDELIKVKSQMHLQEIVFNTTELRTGTDFRFRIGDGGTIGNGNIPISQDLLAQVRIADVVAASSCFPGGFEPIAFPNDFKLQNDWHKYWKYEEPLPLLDGGIYDNLGIGAILLADDRIKRRAEKEQDSTKKKSLQNRRVGTLIISDTDNIGLAPDANSVEIKKQTIFPTPKSVDSSWLNQITLKQLVFIIRSVFVIFLLNTIGSVLYALYTVWTLKSITGVGIFATWVSIVFGGLTIPLYLITSFINKLSYIPKSESESNESLVDSLQAIVLDWRSFLQEAGKLSLADIFNLVGMRLVSIFPIFIAFLKGQRRQTYELVSELQQTQDLVRKLRQTYGLVGEVQDYKQLNIIINFILEAAQKRPKKQEDADKGYSRNDLIPSKEMADFAVEATKTSTTLWFDAEQKEAKKQLDTIIACGQFTMCFNLLDHIEEISKNQTLSDDMKVVRERVQAAWNLFLEQPDIWVGDNREKAITAWNELLQKPVSTL